MQLPPPITSRTNAKVKALRAAFSGKASEPGEIVGIEGEHLVSEALASGLMPDTLFLREGSEALLALPSLAGFSKTRIAVLSREVFASAMDTASPQGIAAMLAIPAPAALPMRTSAGISLFLEDIQDPGNLGTLIRSAEAFGAQAVYVTPATVGAWNPKTMRASAGSIFRIPVLVSPLAEFARDMGLAGIKLVAAVVRGDGATSLIDANLHQPCALMIGNEGAGLSAIALAAAGERVHIPCAVESLNAAIAGAVLLYEASRQKGNVFARGAL